MNPLVSDEEYKRRIRICKSCEYLSVPSIQTQNYWKGWRPDKYGRKTIKDDTSLGLLDYCNKCYCLMTIKARFATCDCPHDPPKW